jgi:hypothetical protein
VLPHNRRSTENCSRHEESLFLRPQHNPTRVRRKSHLGLCFASHDPRSGWWLSELSRKGSSASEMRSAASNSRPCSPFLPRVQAAAAAGDAAAVAFLAEVTTVPAWLQWERVAEGQQFFLRNLVRPTPQQSLKSAASSLAGGESSRASPPHRPREDGLAHLTDTSR